MKNYTISMHFTDAPTYDLITSMERGYKSAINRLRTTIINRNKLSQRVYANS